MVTHSLTVASDGDLEVEVGACRRPRRRPHHPLPEQARAHAHSRHQEVHVVRLVDGVAVFDLDLQLNAVVGLPTLMTTLTFSVNSLWCTCIRMYDCVSQSICHM